MIRRVFERIATQLLVLISRAKWGVSAVLMPFIVQRFGPFGAIVWMARNIPPYERAIVDLGPLRGNFIFAMASLLNGCSYCTYAHGRAFELHYFDTRGKLFPLDDHQLISLIPLTDALVRERLEGALLAADLPDELEVFRRLYALKLEGAVSTGSRDDGHLVHAIKMYDALNFCAIDSQAALDDAHDRINKDAGLKRRYAEARLAAGRRDLTLEEVQ
jgi:hypothetical protein